MSSHSSLHKHTLGSPNAPSTSTSAAGSSSSVLTPAQAHTTASTSSHHLLDLTLLDHEEESPPVVTRTSRGPPRIDRNELRPIQQQGPLPNRQVPAASFYSAALAPPRLTHRIASNRITTYGDLRRNADRAWDVHHSTSSDNRSTSLDMSHGHKSGVPFAPQDPTMKGKSRQFSGYTAGNGGWSNSGPSSHSYSQPQHQNAGTRRRMSGPSGVLGGAKIFNQAMQSAVPSANPASRRNPTKALPLDREPKPDQVAGMKRIGRISQAAPVDRPSNFYPAGSFWSSRLSLMLTSNFVPPIAEPRRLSPDTELTSKRTISQAAGAAIERRANSGVQVKGTADATSKAPHLDVKGKGKAIEKPPEPSKTHLEISSDEEEPNQDVEDDIEGFDDEKPRQDSHRHGQRRASTSAAASNDSKLNNKESSPDALAMPDKAERAVFHRDRDQSTPIIGPFTRGHAGVGEGARHAQEVIGGQNVDVKKQASVINRMQPRNGSRPASSTPLAASVRSVNGDGNPSNDLILGPSKKFIPRRANKPKEDITSVATMVFVVEALGIPYRIASTGDCRIMHNSKGVAGLQQLTLRCGDDDVCCLRSSDISGFEKLDDNKNLPMLAIKLSASATEAATKLAHACKFRREGTPNNQIVVWLRFICEPLGKLPEDDAVRRIFDLVARDWPKHLYNKHQIRVDSALTTSPRASDHPCPFLARSSSSAMATRIEMFDMAVSSGRPMSTRRQSAGFVNVESATSTLANSPRTRQASDRDGSGSGVKRGESPQELENGMTSIGQRTKRVPRKSAEAARGRFAEATADTVDEQYAWQIEEDGTPLERTVLVYPLQGDKTVVSVTHGDTKRLVDGKYLNDTLIEYGLKRAFLNLVERDTKLVEGSKPLAPLVHMFNSFFYKKLDRRGLGKQQTYDSVAKWTAKFDLFEKRIVIVPINEKNHWYLAIVYNPGAILKGDLTVPKQTRKTRHSQLEKADAMATELGVSSSAGSATDTTLEQPDVPAPDLQEPVETSRFFQNPRASKKATKPTAFKTDKNVMDVDAELVEETPEEDPSAMEIDELADDANFYNGEGLPVKIEIEKDEDDTATNTKTVLTDGEVTLASMPNRGNAPETAQLSRNEVLASSNDTDAESSSAVEKALVGPTAKVNLSAPTSAQSGKPLKRTPTPISPSTRPPGTRSPPPPPLPPRQAKNDAAELTIGDTDNEATPLPPMDVTTQCYIMTFDSLGDAHRPVGKNLKDYLRREALAKKGLDISESWVESNAEAFAVDVPQQDNCSDCGLYLIHFVEQFLVDPDDRLRYILPDPEPFNLIVQRYRDEKTRAERAKDSSKEDKAVQLQELLRQRDTIWKGTAAKSKRGELREEVKLLAEQWAEMRRPLEEEEARKRLERAARKAEEKEARLAAELAQTRAEHGDDMADLPDVVKATSAPPSTRVKRTLGDDAPLAATRVEEVEKEKTPKATSEVPDVAADGPSGGENGKPVMAYGKKGKAAAGKSGKGKKKEAQEIILSSGDESNEPSASPPKRMRPLDDKLSVPIAHIVPPPRAPRHTSTGLTAREAALRAPTVTPVSAEASTSAFKRPLALFPPAPPTVAPVNANRSIPATIDSSRGINVDEAYQMITEVGQAAPAPDSSPLEVASIGTTNAIQHHQSVLLPPSAPCHPSRSTRSRDEAESELPPNKRQAVSSEVGSAFALPANGSAVVSGGDSTTPTTKKSGHRRQISQSSDSSELADLPDHSRDEMEMPPSAQTPRAVVPAVSKRIPRASLRHSDKAQSTASPSNNKSNRREPDVVVIE
ncbi:BZ3500_MvSof-1268-A1-R1_Chr3-2g06319 [Microbotryum saponariae]|uniref:BZ3500_MvSof-1268-A1-R1_Chr3-2g06319 protein n=1 Tax=Microbotryum saponariae TaxID=289078 RepID=A0A2X0LGP0_9BASI|nr:BZ3500_MvSof-1268-A1-R1_Chr3-2g06319 [Microbotryum saponariae]SDA04290.1 BZ3501_MvSof-1269-A2-R1_Chr3-2g06010 [Microbotryum saponariae]